MATPEEQLKKLKKKRGGHKAFITKIIKESEGLLANADLEGDELEKLKNELETNLQVLKEKSSIIKEIDDQILELVEENDTDVEIAEAGDYNRGIVKATVAITRWQKGNNENHSSSSRNSNPHSNVKLQRINLDHYNGDPLTFQSFWDSFESAVHNNAAFEI